MIQALVILYLGVDRLRPQPLPVATQIHAASLPNGKSIQPDPQTRNPNRNVPPPMDLLLRIGDMAKDNPQAAIARAEMEKDLDRRGRLFDAIAKEWLKKDPEACFAWVMSLTTPNEKSSALVTMALSLASSADPQAAIELINRVPKGEFKDDMIVYAFRSLFQADATSAMQLVDSLSGLGSISAVARAVVESLAANGKFADAEDLWDSLPHGNFKSDFATQLVLERSKMDPGAALDWIAAHSGQLDARDCLGHIADAFAKTDGAAGMTNADKITDPALKQQYLNALALAWGRKNPAEASQWLLKELDLTGYSANAKVANLITEESLQWDHAATLAAIRTLADPATRAQALTAALAILSQFDPATAAGQLLPLVKPDSAEGLQALGRVTANWLERDPLAASDWIASLAKGPVKDASITVLIGNILAHDKDYDMASRWAASLDSEPARAAAVEKIRQSKDGAK